MSKLTDKILEEIRRHPTAPEPYGDMLDVLYSEMKAGDKSAHDRNKAFRNEIARGLRECGDYKKQGVFNSQYKKSLLMDAQVDLDAYIQYLEYERDPDKRFYLPRRDVLRPLVQDLQDLYDGEIDFLGVSMPPRVGKALAFDTPVLTRQGWKKHGSLSLMDEVIAPDGSFVKVLAIHPACEMEYEVSFTNGEKVICHGNHEWEVYNRHRQKTELLETKAMVNDFDNHAKGRSHRYHYLLPERKPVLGENKVLPVDPYVLGVWLGNGRNSNPDICGAAEDTALIVPQFERAGYSPSWSVKHGTTGVMYYGFKTLREGLQSIGMCHSRRRTPKHIPEEYLTASLEQRLSLLAGLLDTDGTLRREEHRYVFSTTEESLKDGFISLISTFGWRCSVVPYAPKVSSSGIKGQKTIWAIGFNPAFEIPCVIPRKQLKEFSQLRRIAISDIRPISGQQGNCITVEGGMYCVGRQLIPTHNSTMCIMFVTWLMGNRPDVASVMSGHSDKLTDGFYRELLSILTDSTTYAWGDVFPTVKLVDTSAKNETIDLNHSKRFPTMTCRSIGGTLTGAVEIGSGGLLYVDDLIEDLEESLNPLRLQAKYDAYLNQLKDRKKMGALELMVGTRWNVYDPLGRVHDQYQDDPRYRFRVIPALNEDGESNFNYKYGLGFDTRYYQDMKASIDDATWNAKYMGSPYIREGLLFSEDELRYYNGVLPDGEPDKVAVCDVAWGGGDSLAMPFAYVYGENVYIPDVIFNRGDKTVTYPIVIGRCMQHLPNTVRMESNNGGSEYCDKVDEELRKLGVRLNMYSIRTPSTRNKVTRITQYAPDIKKFYFLADKYQTREYRAFMKEVTMFVQTGKNLHDDAPDSLAMLAEELFHRTAKIEFVKRPF